MLCLVFVCVYVCVCVCVFYRMHLLLIDHTKERRRRRQKKIMIETTKEKDRQCTSRSSQGACAGEAGLECCVVVLKERPESNVMPRSFTSDSSDTV